MSTGIERPIELVPAVHREMLGKRSGVLRLPMRPQPVLSVPQWARLAGALIELGHLYALNDTGAGLLNAAMQEGLLADLRCPWGRGGDVLWSREPWAADGRGYLYRCRDAARGAGVVWMPAHRMPRAAARLLMKIDHVEIGQDEAGSYVWEIDVVRVCNV